MKKSFMTTSIAILLASISTATLSSSVTIPNTFSAGTPAVAADVNANFDAVATSVNDNDSRVTSNTSDITSNTSDITANTAAIDQNTQDIAALQGGASCSTDMVAVGSICIDTYEASVWDAATGGTQINPTADLVTVMPCDPGGADCADGAANPIYARSVQGVKPALNISWYQAAIACANVGKRLATTAEWQMAAAGTPAGGDSVPDCNSDSIVDTLADTGATLTCTSTAGAFDMVGNIMEWSADLAPVAPGAASTDDTDTWALGNSYRNNVTGLPPTTKALFVPGSGPAAVNPQIGFRCAR